MVAQVVAAGAEVAVEGAVAAIEEVTGVVAEITGSVDEASVSIANLGEKAPSRLDKLKEGFKSVGEAAKKTAEQIVDVFPGLEGLKNFTSLSGLSKLAQGFASFSDDLEQASRRIGMNTQSLAAWHAAAKAAGMTTKQFDDGMAKSQDAIRAAAHGEAPETAAMMHKLHVRTAHNRDGSIDYLTTQQRLMTAIHRMPNVVDQRDAAETAGMTDWLPMMQQGTWNDDKAKAYRRGLVPTEEEVARAKAFKDDISDLSDSVEDFGNRIGSALMPVLDPVIKKMSEWLDAHRAQIADQISTAVQKFVNWVSNIDWDRIGNFAEKAFNTLKNIAEEIAVVIGAISFAGLIAGAVSLVGVLMPLAATVLPAVLAGLELLAPAVLAVGAAWGALKLAKWVGVPGMGGPKAANDLPKGVNDVREGRWGAAFTHLPLGDFARASLARVFGKSNTQAAGAIEKRHAEDGNKPAGGQKTWQAIADSSANYVAGQALFGTTKQYRDMLDARRQRPGDAAATFNDDAYGFGPLAFSSIGRRPLGPVAPQGSPVQSPLSGTAPAWPLGNAPTGTVTPPAGEVALRVTFDNVPAGTRVEARSPSGAHFPTKINYAMGGDMRGLP